MVDTFEISSALWHPTYEINCSLKYTEHITDINKIDDTHRDGLDDVLDDQKKVAIGMKDKYELYCAIRNEKECKQHSNQLDKQLDVAQFFLLFKLFVSSSSSSLSAGRTKTVLIEHFATEDMTPASLIQPE